MRHLKERSLKLLDIFRGDQKLTVTVKDKLTGIVKSNLRFPRVRRARRKMWVGKTVEDKIIVHVF